MKTFLYQNDHALMLTPDDIDATDLMAALVAMRQAWRAGRETYDVPTMCAFGDAIAAIERLIDFAPDASDATSARHTPTRGALSHET